ncbi:MAG TPA: hypothetical protein VH419_17735 [Nocardioidaceae bacterium]|jgi:hypothetical protein
MDDAGAVVRTLLEAAGISPPDDEVEELAESYARLRAMVDALYGPAAATGAPAFLPHPAQVEPS